MIRPGVVITKINFIRNLQKIKLECQIVLGCKILPGANTLAYYATLVTCEENEVLQIRPQIYWVG